MRRVGSADYGMIAAVLIMLALAAFLFWYFGDLG